MDWLAVELLVLEPEHWNDVDFRVGKQAQVKSFL